MMMLMRILMKRGMVCNKQSRTEVDTLAKRWSSGAPSSVTIMRIRHNIEHCSKSNIEQCTKHGAMHKIIHPVWQLRTSSNSTNSSTYNKQNKDLKPTSYTVQQYLGMQSMSQWCHNYFSNTNITHINVCYVICTHGTAQSMTFTYDHEHYKHQCMLTS